MTPAAYLQLLLEVMLPVALLVAAGGWWRRFLGDARVRAVRGYITTITVNLFVPALLFHAAASARITMTLLSVPLLLATGMVLTGLALYALLFHSAIGRGMARPTKAGLLLCGAFGNVLFLGYPLLTHLYGGEGARYAAFADMAAATPLLWSIGVWIAVRLGGGVASEGGAVATWLKLPPVWAFVLGVVVANTGAPIEPLLNAARLIGQPTVPVMLLMLGLSVPWAMLRPRTGVLVVVGFKLLLLPLAVLAIALVAGVPPSDARAAAVIEASVPTMLMALGIADRYDLDVESVALAVAWSTLLFLLSLPVWLAILL